MDKKVVETVLGYSSKSCKILFGRSGNGNVRIKVKHGPLGMLTTRYKLDLETYDEIKKQLKLRHGQV